MSDTHKKLYELAYFMSSSIKEEDVLKHVQKLREALEKQGAEITKEELPKNTRLAYPIKHEKEGYFGWMHAQLPPEKLKDLNMALNLSDDVLRFLFTEVTKSQIAQMQAGKFTRFHKPKAEESVESVLREGAKSHVEEQKVEIGGLDEKLEEILNK